MDRDHSAPLDSAERSALYSLAARLFATEVDTELYRHLISSDNPNHSESSGHIFIEPELRALCEAHAIEALAIDYCRLFIGPRPICPPYASAHRGEVSLGGRAEQRLQEFLTRHDLAVDMAVVRIASPDHVAVELSVLAHIHGSMLPGSAREAAREFLRDHVLSWMPSYLELVSSSAERALYRSVARLAAEALDDELATLGL
jgi:TorA maturation chaperone TorD